MHFSLIRITTPKVPDTRGADDALLAIRFALAELGYQTEIITAGEKARGRVIAFGANYDPEGRWVKLPPDSILINLEQLRSAGYPWLRDNRYLEILRRHEVWDFSRTNVDYLAGQGVQAAFLPLVYVPQMSRLAPCPAPDVDVLFYGTMTRRRRHIIEQLRDLGLKVLCLESCYGQKRDQALYRSALLINIHHSLPAELEIVRLGYALANARAVVSELDEETGFYPELKDACLFQPYQRLAEAAASLARDRAQLARQAARGFEIFSSLKLKDYLAQLLGYRIPASQRPPQRPPRPLHLRLGSGPLFLSSALNVDPDERQKPDLRASLDEPAALKGRRLTERFGEIELADGSFQLISLPEGVLASVKDPDALMSRCLELLAEGGRLIVTVPYDLSLEAAGFSRAFNERSFHRYGPRPAPDLGWSEAAFELKEMSFILSDYGLALAGRGLDLERLKTRPRAVARLRAVLVKRALSPEDKTALAAAGRGIYTGVQGLWLSFADIKEEEIDRVRQPHIPGPWALRLALARLMFRRLRYRFMALAHWGRHERYEDKMKKTEAESRRLKRFLSLGRS